jgi:hypothetical protein
MALSQSKRENIHKTSDKLCSPYCEDKKGCLTNISFGAEEILSANVI